MADPIGTVMETMVGTRSEARRHAEVHIQARHAFSSESRRRKDDAASVCGAASHYFYQVGYPTIFSLSHSLSLKQNVRSCIDIDQTFGNFRKFNL